MNQDLDQLAMGAADVLFAAAEHLSQSDWELLSVGLAAALRAVVLSTRAQATIGNQQGQGEL